MLLIPAPVRSDGRLPTIKFGGTGAPLTLAVNCVIRSRTRFATTVIGGPAFAGAVSRISTAWPGSNCDVSVAPWKALTNPLGAFSTCIMPEELPVIVRPGDGKFTVDVSVPVGLISHTAPVAQPASVPVVPFLKVSSGFANVRFKLVYVPGATLAVFKNPDSVSRFSTSIRTGPRPASKSTLPGLSVAPVTLTSNESTLTPAGGVSVTVTDSAGLPCCNGFDMDPPQL